MNGETLYNAVSDIRPEFLDEAEAFSLKRRRNPLRGWAMAAACLCLCAFGTLPALAAADNPLAYRILHEISPAFAQMLKPVNISCVDNGIEMRVDAANVSADGAAFRVTLRDIEGNRLDETTDLFDSYAINAPCDQSAGCSSATFDADTCTATFLIDIRPMKSGALIVGDKLTFSVNRLLAGKHSGNVPIEAIDLATVAEASDLLTDIPERGGDSLDRVLRPAQSIPVSPDGGAQLTAYGLVDGRLHIQLHFDDILRTDNHGFVYLIDSDGNSEIGAESCSFWDESRKGSYEEMVFDVPAERLGEYAVRCEYFTCDTLIEGNWEVTFPLSE